MKTLLFLCCLALSACGVAKSSDRARAERVFTDQAGFVCFIIRSEDGKAIGGNCVRE